MSQEVGLWIDHRRAVVVFLVDGRTTSETILSNVEKHVRASGGSRSATVYGPQDVAPGDRVDRKFDQHLEKYYDRVARALQKAEAILIMGPGEAKHEFHKHLQKSKKATPPDIKVETTDKMTDPEIMARVREHFVR